MFDVKARQNHLREAADWIADLCMYFDENFNDEIVAFEINKPFSKFLELAAEFSRQFDARAAMYHEPPFANAQSDAELREAASRRHSTAQAILAERWKSKGDAQERDAHALRVAEWSIAECNFIFHATAGSDGGSENV